MNPTSDFTADASSANAEEAVTVADTPRRRLTGEARERAIVEEAVKFFAEVGFDGDTRELARRIGVTQSLIFKYFPSGIL